MTEKNTDSVEFSSILPTMDPTGDMHPPRLAFMAYAAHSHFGIEIRIAAMDHHGRPIAIAEPLKFSPRENGAYAKPCMIVPRKEDMQGLMDCLWGLGLRPTGKPDLTDGEREAMRDHIQTLKDSVRDSNNARVDVRMDTAQHIADLRKTVSLMSPVHFVNQSVGPLPDLPSGRITPMDQP